MGHEPYEAGIGSVSSYQVSGHPYLTGSLIENGVENQIEFPFVTKTFTILNTGSNTLRIHFNSTASSANVIGRSHYFNISAGSAFTYDVKCRNLYISNGSGGQSGYQIAAELTRIDKNRMYPLTGSGISE